MEDTIRASVVMTPEVEPHNDLFEEGMVDLSVVAERESLNRVLASGTHSAMIDESQASDIDSCNSSDDDMDSHY